MPWTILDLFYDWPYNDCESIAITCLWHQSIFENLEHALHCYAHTHYGLSLGAYFDHSAVLKCQGLSTEGKTTTNWMIEKLTKYR